MKSGRTRNQAGTSLIEVLVVMVVLIIGILVVLRVFPLGDRSLVHAQNVSLAGRLAAQELEKWKNRAANLPEGILPIVYDGDAGMYKPDLDLRLGPPIDDDNVANFRRIVGEVVRIPVGTHYDLPGNDDRGSIYVLGFSPIQAVFDNNGLPINVAVQGGDMQGEQYDSDNSDIKPWEWLSSAYGIDYQRGKICFRVSPVDRTFYITYSYWTGNPPVLMRIMPPDYNSSIDVPAGTAAWLAIPGFPAGGAVFDAGSETVARGFRYKVDLATDPWTGDPYEYTLVDPVVGIVAFNPAGYSFRETTESGVRDLEAHITYDMLDRQIISEERTMPTGDLPYTVKLTLQWIKEKDVTIENDDTGSLYKGLAGGKLVGNFDGTLICPDVLIVNPADGARIWPREVNLDPSGKPIIVVDFKAGSVAFTNNTVKAYMPGMLDSDDPIDYDISGRTLRFYYQADGDWSIQLHKAYERYTEQELLAPYDMDHRRFFRDGGTLYFKPCDSGKTVAVTYEYTAGSGVLTAVGECHKTSDYLVGLGDNSFCYVDLDHGAEAGDIVSVAGVSVKARALWREGGRWLYVDMDSSLRRRPTER